MTDLTPTRINGADVCCTATEETAALLKRLTARTEEGGRQVDTARGLRTILPPPPPVQARLWLRVVLMVAALVYFATHIF